MPGIASIGRGAEDSAHISQLDEEGLSEREFTASSSGARSQAPAEGAMQRYAHVEEPPLMYVAPKDVDTIFAQFEKHAGEYSTDNMGMPVIAPRPTDEARGSGAAKQDEPLATAWRERAGATTSTVRRDKLLRGAEDGTQGDTYVYPLTDTTGQTIPVAVMRLAHHPEETSVELVASSPAVTGGGKTMIEEAANLSDEAGHQGRLSLESTQASKGFYEKLGFIGSVDKMTLNPAESDLWTQKADGLWALRENEGKNYLADNPQSTSREETGGS